MEFLTLDRDAFRYGAAETVAPLVRRVIAENPSKFTYHGTGTYIVGGDANGRGDVAVIDPGPRLDSHRDALAAALDGCTVRAVLITHCHADHSPLAAWLAGDTGAPTVAFGPHGDDAWDIGDDPFREQDVADDPDAGDAAAGNDTGAGTDSGVGTEASGEVVVEESTDRDFVPDEVVRSGDVAVAGSGWTVNALHTPGHTSNHTCFVLDDGDRRTIFTGDHVMGWSTTVVSPPDGDMAAYLDSLRMVAGRRDDLAIPTHGPPIVDPQRFVSDLIEHRLERERQVLDAVRAGIVTIPEIVDVLYAQVRKELHKPARRSVLAHLVKLVDDGVIGVVASAEPVAGGGVRPRLDSTFGA